VVEMKILTGGGDRLWPGGTAQLGDCEVVNVCIGAPIYRRASRTGTARYPVDWVPNNWRRKGLGVWHRAVYSHYMGDVSRGKKGVEAWWGWGRGSWETHTTAG